MSPTLNELDDYALIWIFSALSIPDIQTLRRVCRRLWYISMQHAVWLDACKTHILQENIPFPSRPLCSLCSRELEQRTMRAYHLGLNWRAESTRLHLLRTVPGNTGAIEEIKFLRTAGKSWIITISRGIWSDLYLWDCDTIQPVGHWSPGRAIFNGMAINSDQSSMAVIAISVKHSSHSVIEILSLVSESSSSRISFRSITTLETRYKPSSLRGDIIALSDHDSETLIMDWKTGNQYLLRSPDTWQDKPLHVAFAAGNVFVVRSRSVCVFAAPPLIPPGDETPVNLPHSSTSFGWVDGVSLSERSIVRCTEKDPPLLSLLVRTKGDDPWSLKDQLQLFTVNSSPPTEGSSGLLRETSSTVSITPPRLALAASLTCPNRGPLRCSDIVLGRYGSAVWVLPADRSIAGLISEHVHLQTVPVPSSNQTLVVAAFPGPLSNEAQIKASIENEEGSSWFCLDYDEERGLIALGSATGNITIFSL
ncbi:hypothetical protein EDD16DRAFT_1477601 [Pisolithus croceorrhizus]|nr:hypothetical protein EDD16DRAFT_1477601 [Pisolithus croceorrhizus]